MGFDDLEAAEREHQEGTTEGDERATEADDQATEADEQATGQRQSEQPHDEASTTGTGTDEQVASQSSSADDASEGIVADEPGFEFGDVKQSPMYARPEAWAALEDALDLDVVRALRESGVRNEEKRELHDAALRVAAEHPEEIAEAVRAARRED